MKIGAIPSLNFQSRTRAMANNNDLWLVTHSHRVTAERVTPKVTAERTPKEEGMSFAGMVGVGLVIFFLLGLIGAFAGHCP
jgi:hypothetical protein